MKADSFCPVCGSADVEAIGSYHGNHPIFSGLKLANCRLCWMGFANPMPQDSDLDNYNASYFVSAHGGKQQNSLAKAFFSGIALLRLAHIEHYLNRRDIAVSTLLEFGPGTGFFARRWLAKYPQTAYKAHETDTSCYTSLQEIGVTLVVASAQIEDTDPVDLVVMSHVLEHVSNPIEFLKNATQNLRKGGVLFIEVPCRDWEHKPIYEPHLLFFDKDPMQHLLRNLGFEDIKMSYHGQEIEQLRSASVWRSKLMALRSKLIALGLVAPFSRIKPGMEILKDQLERAVLSPFKAYLEIERPAWWLRAIARKGQVPKSSS